MKTNKEIPKSIYSLVSGLIVLSVWKLLTVYFPPLVVPTISSVINSLLVIFTGAQLYQMIMVTMVRLIIGLTIGVAAGFVVGVFMGHFKFFKGIAMPIIGLFQTIPPVSWVVLALVWFGFNGKPAIFIVVTSAMPIIAINVYEGIINIDSRLLQMAKLYRFSEWKRLHHIVLPSVASYFNSGFRVALGSSWKIAVMGEVFTTSDGIGGMIKLARLNVEPENIIAWSIVVVMLFYVSDYLIGKILIKEG
ncbi:ABC transporter permease [Petroclostridium sp. X23]|uniref:ABC transporter permease n=1 Tax=Petroclostridium sp. X23 TaxID=3045146 RepID=UPI0024AD99CD|nr:ABC transporter permease [Petroclostridium sp. X23]WHH58687.1 ABC transporter permease [Petroclostridium sp. X23]